MHQKGSTQAEHNTLCHIRMHGAARGGKSTFAPVLLAINSATHTTRKITLTQTKIGH